MCVLSCTVPILQSVNTIFNQSIWPQVIDKVGLIDYCLHFGKYKCPYQCPKDISSGNRASWVPCPQPVLQMFLLFLWSATWRLFRQPADILHNTPVSAGDVSGWPSCWECAPLRSLHGAAGALWARDTLLRGEGLEEQEIMLNLALGERLELLWFWLR